MTRENSLRITVIVAVLTTTVIVAALGVGTSSVGAETVDEVYINQTGTPTDIVPGDTSHTIHDIMIDTNNSDFGPNEIRISVNLSKISTHGVNTSTAYVDDTSIKNGHLHSQEKYISENGTESLHLVIEYTGDGDPLQINKLVIGGITTNNAEMKSNVRYSFEVSDNSTRTFEDSFANTDDSTVSNEFNIAGGSFQFRDQATGSTDGDQFTIPSATIEDVEANVNSTLIVAYEDDETRIAGIKSVSRDTISQSDEISIRYLEANGFPGPHTIYLVPESKLSSENYSAGDKLPTKASKFSIATRVGDSLFASLDFNNISANTTIEDNITIENARLDDEYGGKTPYIVTIHPVLSNGSILTHKYIGRSQIIAGDNQDVEIELINEDGDPVLLSQSNQYAAIIRLVDDNSEVGDPVSLESSSILQNSDLNQQFVQNGVSDTALISINKSEEDRSTTNQIFNNTSINRDDEIYAGDLIAFEESSDDENRIELYRELTQTESVLQGVESTTDDSKLVYFNTSQLPTGNYSLSGGEYTKQSHFKIIGRDDQYSNLTSISKSSVVSDRLEFNLEADSNTTNITITDSKTNDSIATATVTTPRDESTSLEFNTYTAGDPELESDLFTLDGPGTIESVTTSTANGTIPAGEYTVTATAEPGGPTDTATVTLRNRSTNGLSVYSTAESDADAFSTPESITDSIANGTLAPAENVTEGDTVVYAVNATGLSGYTAVRDPTLATGGDLDRLDGLEFTVSNESETDPNATPATTANGTTVLTRETGLFLVDNGTETLNGSLGTSAETDLEATFDVVDERLRDAAGSNASHGGAARFTYVRNTTDTDDAGDSEGADDTDDADDSEDPDTTSDDQETTSSDDTADSENTTDAENTTDSDNVTDSENTTELDDTTDSDGSMDSDDVNDSTAENTTDGDGDDLEATGETSAVDGSNDSDGSVDETEETTAESDLDGEDVGSEGSDGADSGGGGRATSGGGGSSGATGGSGGTGGGGAGTGGGGAGTGDSDADSADRDGNGGAGDGGGTGDDADRSGSPGVGDGGSADEGSRSDSEQPGSTPDADDGAEPDPSTDRDQDTPGVGDDDADPGSSSNPATNDGRASGDAPARASTVRAVEERALRDRREIGPHPVEDSNDLEEGGYVPRPENASYAPAVATTGEGGHDDTPSVEGSGDGEAATPSDDERSQRPPTFEEAPLRSTAYDVPGFGVPAALIAITAVSVVAGRRGTP